MVAIGTNTQTPSGLANLAVQFYFRAMSPDDTTISNLGTAVAAYALTVPGDADRGTKAQAAGESIGTFAQVLLQVQIPTNTEAEMAYYQPASSFGKKWNLSAQKQLNSDWKRINWQVYILVMP